MTIAELGSLGEFIGSLVVLVTLTFFGLQFRQFRQSLNSSTSHQTFQQLNQLNATLAADPEMAEIMERAYADPGSLSEMEQRRYSWMQTCYFNMLANLYEQYLEGTCRERRCVETGPANDENIVAGALRDKAFGVEHDRLFKTRVQRLDFRQHVVEIVQRFDRRVDCTVQVACGGDSDNPHTLFVKFRWV